MDIIIILIIASLLMAGGFLVAFFWSVRDGQYDDDITPSMRVLIEEDMLGCEIEDDSLVNTNKLKTHNKSNSF